MGRTFAHATWSAQELATSNHPIRRCMFDQTPIPHRLLALSISTWAKIGVIFFLLYIYIYRIYLKGRRNYSALVFTVEYTTLPRGEKIVALLRITRVICCRKTYEVFSSGIVLLEFRTPPFGTYRGCRSFTARGSGWAGGKDTSSGPKPLAKRFPDKTKGGGGALVSCGFHWAKKKPQFQSKPYFRS